MFEMSRYDTDEFLFRFVALPTNVATDGVTEGVMYGIADTFIVVCPVENDVLPIGQFDCVD